jgi:hypothetical protein
MIFDKMLDLSLDAFRKELNNAQNALIPRFYTRLNGVYQEIDYQAIRDKVTSAYDDFKVVAKFARDGRGETARYNPATVATQVVIARNEYEEFIDQVNFAETFFLDTSK